VLLGDSATRQLEPVQLHRPACVSHLQHVYYKAIMNREHQTVDGRQKQIEESWQSCSQGTTLCARLHTASSPSMRATAASPTGRLQQAQH
jgi:hypothetical protein